MYVCMCIYTYINRWCGLSVQMMYYWVGVTEAVKTWIRACAVCQSRSPGEAPNPPVRFCLAYGCDASSYVYPELSFHRSDHTFTTLYDKLKKGGKKRLILPSLVWLLPEPKSLFSVFCLCSVDSALIRLSCEVSLQLATLRLNHSLFFEHT